MVAAQARRIPIVCPGHTRPLAEVQFLHVAEENRTLLVSACHGECYPFGFSRRIYVSHTLLSDKKPMIRDGTTGDWIGTFSGHKGAVWSCRLDPTGNLAATASGDFSVQVWDAITGQSLYHFPHQHIVKSCDFSPSSKFLASVGHEGILRVYNLLTPKADPMEIPPVEGQKVVMSKVCWWSDEVVLVGCADGKIGFYQVFNGTPEDNDTSWRNNPPSAPSHVLDTGSKAEIRDMELTTLQSTGQSILTVASGNKVYFYDVNSKQLLKSYPVPIHFKEEGGASLHPSGTQFVAGGSDLWVRVYDFATGKELDCLKGHHGPIRCLRYSPNGQLFASGSEDGTIRLWETA